MAGKNKGGREARKPKAAGNQKAKGQTPPQGSATIESVSGRPTKARP